MPYTQLHKDNNFLGYIANAIAAVATATTIMSLTALNQGAQEIARLQEQIKSEKEQLSSIQATLTALQNKKLEDYTRTEAFKDFSLRDQSIQRLEGEIETLRQRVGK